MIDVIIPAYNAHDTIGRTLSSIAMQNNIKRIKVTIVDDASPNGGYKDFVDTFSKLMDIQEITLSENGGPAVARQAGIDETDGDFIAFIDADDTYLGANALALMEREMVYGDLDVVGGEFVEEVENSKFVKHGENMVWVFAKMYRRSFLDRFLIRFNDTRANEDTGFNAVVANLTRHIKHIPQAVYMWHWRDNSITRVNNGVYATASGHQGYIENMIWATNELCGRNVNKELIRNHVVTVFCRLYFMHMAICYSNPDYAEGSMEYIKEFYKICYAPLSDYIPSVYLQEVFLSEQVRYKDNLTAIISVMTFKEFITAARGD